MSETVNKKCDECGAEIAPTQNHRFCSRNCGYAFRKRTGMSRRSTRSGDTARVTLVCAHCSGEFFRALGEVRNQAFVFCSKACYTASGAMRAGWRGGRPRSKEWQAFVPEWHQPETVQAAEKYGPPQGRTLTTGYVRLFWPAHPAAGMNGSVVEHRVVAYEHVGDAITGMHVDHINNNRADNRWENLAVLSHSDHGKKTARADGSGRNAEFFKWCLEFRSEVVQAWEKSRAVGAKEKQETRSA